MFTIAVPYPTFIISIPSTRHVNMLVRYAILFPLFFGNLNLISEQFSNGVTIISLYLGPLPNSSAPPIEHSIFQVMREASLLFCLPDNPFFLPKSHGSHAVQEAVYACKLPTKPVAVPNNSISIIDCGWIFAQHFCNRLGPAYLQLKNLLNENDPAQAEVLDDIKRRFREETFTRESIAQTIHAYPELVCYFPSLAVTEILINITRFDSYTSILP